MRLDEYTRLDALALGRLVADGEVEPAELVTLAVEAAEHVNPALNAILETYDQVTPPLGTAAVERPLWGVPFLRKDLGSTEKGRKQERGSRLFAGQVSSRSSIFWDRIEAAGLQTIGRTATPELGILGTTESIASGLTRNPWALDRSTGGSSGGAAAAVAAGVVPFAHATDGGGSIRIPAAWCGLVGLLPTRQRIAMGPARQDPLFGLVRELAVSRTVGDTAALLDALQGDAPGEPFAIPAPARPYLKELQRPTGDLTIAVSIGPWSSHPVHPEIAEAVTRTARHLEENGHRVVEVELPVDFDQLIDVVLKAFAFADAALADGVEAMGIRFDPELLEPVTLSMVELGKSLGPAEIRDLFAKLETVRRQMGLFFAEHDLFLTPTMAQPPQPHYLLHQNPDASYRDFLLQDHRDIQFTEVYNASGQPAITLPLAQTSDGLPIGIQLGAAFGREDLLLRTAATLEQQLPWAERVPPTHASQAETKRVSESSDSPDRTGAEGAF